MTTLFYEHLQLANLHEDGHLEMTYPESWTRRRGAFPLSVTMPLSKERHEDTVLLPWLANLLPESHLSEIGQQLKVSPQDVVGLLRYLGRDTAGAISFGVPRKEGTHVIDVRDEQALERILDELPEKPFLVGQQGVSMSLAGVQEKLPVYVSGDGRIGIPVDGTPSTHIMKPNALRKRLPSSVQNEAFCMVLARNVGLDVAEVTTGRAGKRSYLLVKRYDRVSDRDGLIRRIHQEDFCQILGFFPSQKYERSKFGGRSGPTLKMMFKAVEDHVSSGERLKLLDAVIFNVLVCNTDSHAKNYSILIGGGGTTRLAPLYDLLCAAVYPRVDQTLAQSVSGRVDAANLNGGDWHAFAREVGLSPARTMGRVEELADAVLANVKATIKQVADMPAGRTDMLVNIEHEVTKRVRRIKRQLSIGLKAQAGNEPEEEASPGLHA